MKTFHLLSLLLMTGLIFSCSKEKSDGPPPKPNLEQIIGKYQLPPEEIVRRNEIRIWTITKADENHVKVKEDLTTDPNGKNTKVTSRVFDNVAVKAYDGGIIRLSFDYSMLEDPELTINGHKNYKIFGSGNIQPDAIQANLWVKDLNSEELTRYTGVLELIKIK